ncbi:interferon-induced transmembrane protein 1-like [Protopterus annectens]|uniref:interferon-induced transmembrane protein 1-like n=1 Tax=Protopterus annectens TaxID=7888 RepID=UPI001CFC3CE8|nr:interferon-induced transmembrane protein 1-like [Protopterus annectens]
MQSVVIPMQTYSTQISPKKDYVTWSLFNFVFCNPFCLGFVALIFSFKTRDSNLIGDEAGAKTSSSAAKGFNIAATIVTAVTCTIVALVFIFIRVSLQTRGY